jgi:hypothetical protein
VPRCHGNLCRPTGAAVERHLLLARAILPFAVRQLQVPQPTVCCSPPYLFLMAAFFVQLLVETDRLPIHASTHIEVNIPEYSGPLLALPRWASMMKQFILYTIFCNFMPLPVVILVLASKRHPVHRAAVWYGGARQDVARVMMAVLMSSNARRTLYRFIFRPTADATRDLRGREYFITRPVFTHKVAPVFGLYLFAPAVRLVCARPTGRAACNTGISTVTWG